MAVRPEPISAGVRQSVIDIDNHDIRHGFEAHRVPPVDCGCFDSLRRGLLPPS